MIIYYLEYFLDIICCIFTTIYVIDEMWAGETEFPVSPKSFSSAPYRNFKKDTAVFNKRKLLSMQLGQQRLC
jgi:hypothetical protein